MNLQPVENLTIKNIDSLPIQTPPTYVWTLGQAETQGFEFLGVFKSGGVWVAKAKIDGTERLSTLWRTGTKGKVCATFIGFRNMPSQKVAVVLCETR